MTNDLGLKLIAVVDAHTLRAYEEKKKKITRKIEKVSIEFHKEHNHEQGSYQKGSGPSSSFEPHSQEKTIEKEEAAKLAVINLDRIATEHHDYKELIIVAEPKMLGAIRHHLSPRLKKILSRELPKDLAHHDMAAIGQIVFA